VTGSTLDTVSNWYGIHPKFAHAVLETFVGIDYDRNIGDIHKLLARYESSRIQLEYSFSTNGRGRTLVQQLNGWGVSLNGEGTSPKTYLDIGCAYGGFLIAFANQGYVATGIELSGELYGRLGKLNLEASGCQATMTIGDFLSDDIVTGEQKFDLITCNDVIEHVSDPAACLHKICRLLKPGGAAYVASPNKLSIPNVRADVHFQCFGLTLLDYFRARAAYAMYSDSPNYEVSDFYEPEWYVNTAKEMGVQAEVVYDSSCIAAGAPEELALLYSAFAEWAGSGSKKLDVMMRHEMMREMAKYSSRMFQAYSEHIAHNSIDQFCQKWIDPLTRILIRKPSA
jgi:2-polyprenyl-3-methyl-5-hydroxy-6-metoxy-1,4-benzoquinol methylase